MLFNLIIGHLDFQKTHQRLKYTIKVLGCININLLYINSSMSVPQADLIMLQFLSSEVVDKTHVVTADSCVGGAESG